MSSLTKGTGATTIGPKGVERRARAMTVALVVVFTLLVGQLGNLQFVQGAKWAEAADINRMRILPVAAPRGLITDRNGVVLASNRPSYTVTLFYTGDSTFASTVHLLAQILAGDSNTPEAAAKEQEIWKTFLYQKQYVGLYKPMRIETNITPEIYTQIEEHKTDLPGVDVTVEPIREYPQLTDPSVVEQDDPTTGQPLPGTADKLPTSLAAHVIGYVGQISESQLASARYSKDYKGGDVIGKSGLEDYYEQYLRGQEGTRPVMVDHLGRWYADLPGGTSPTAGDNLKLSLDANLQRVAEQALASKIQEFQTRPDAHFASAGAVVVEDVHTGEILAMASYPSFDLNWWVGGISPEHWNLLNTDPRHPMLNYAINAFAPGSTFKMVTASGALQEGEITPSFTIFDTGVYWLWQHPKDWKVGGHGIVDLNKAIAESCDTYFYEAGRRLTVDGLGKYSDAFGFGQPTGIDLFGESKGADASKASYNYHDSKGSVLNDWQLGDTLSQAIGQGRDLATPLQLANYVAAVANGGQLMTPHLVDDILTPDGGTVQAIQPKMIRQVPVSAENLAIVRQGMLSAAEWGTAAGSFGNFPIKIGAKTGTAETTSGHSNGVFVAFAPYDNPEIAISVLVVGGAHGSYAAEVARPILAQYFHVTEGGPAAQVRAD